MIIAMYCPNCQVTTTRPDCPVCGGPTKATQHVTHEQNARYFAEQKSRMVRKLLAMGYSMGWDKPQTASEVGMDRKQLCWQHVNGFFTSDKSVVKKPIDKMTASELRQAITQFQKIQSDFFKKI